MKNLFDYVKENKDLSFDEKPLTEVDAIIFSQFCYIDYRKVFKDIENQKISIEKMAKLLKDNNYSTVLGFLIPDTILPIFYLMSTTKRYKNLILEKYVNILDKSLVEQFCAITINIKHDLKIVVYCGTDDSVVGWKENLNMLCLDVIPSQKKSVEYLNNASKKFKGQLVVIGHSKGGNLAFYAGIHSNRWVKPKISRVYSFDGPGFNRHDAHLLEKSKYKDKFVSYITECSVVGKLFEHKENTIICKSRVEGLMQHDSFSWIVEDDRFIRAENINFESQSIDKTIKEIVSSMKKEQKQEFVSAIFRLVDSANVDYLLDLKITSKIGLIKTYFKAHKDDRRVINSVVLKMMKDKYLRKIVILCIIDFMKKKPYSEENLEENSTNNLDNKNIKH